MLNPGLTLTEQVAVLAQQVDSLIVRMQALEQDQAAQSAAPAGSLRAWFIGSLKSWTIWLGVLVASIGEWWPLVERNVGKLLGEEPAKKLALIVGIVIILFRYRTTESIPSKGTPNA